MRPSYRVNELTRTSLINPTPWFEWFVSRGMDLTNRQWKLIEPLLPPLSRRPDGRGRPWRSSRDVLNGILWILRTGAQWKELPKRYPPYQTCHRRFQQWVRDGTLHHILRRLAEDLTLDPSESFIDAMFSPAKKGDLQSARPFVARARKPWQWRTAMACRALLWLPPPLPTM
jgi:transposase